MPLRLNDLLPRLRPFALPLLVAAAAAVGAARGLGLALLVVAGGMLLFAISNLWESVQRLGDDGELTVDEALALAAPSAEEEKKRSVLRALKDLEYERSVGKVGDDDYAVLSARYRDEARRLLQALDRAETPARQRVERLIAKRLERAGIAATAAAAATTSPPSDDDASDDEVSEDAASGDDDAHASEGPATSQNDADDPADEDDDDANDDDANDDGADDGVVSAQAGGAAAETATCGDCGTRNDPDARFCKHCGESLS